MSYLVGTIAEIVRHPVKSFSGERIKETEVTDYGLLGDRSHCFLDETRPGRYLTATQLPQMIGFQASFLGEREGDQYPPVRVTAPNGQVYDWDDPDLLGELERLSERHLSRVVYPPEHVPKGAIEEEHIQLVSDASLNELERIWGRSVDHRRFRANLVISLTDPQPFAEESWFGKRLKIGEVELEVVRPCERCMIVTIDPEDTERDPTLLKTIFQERSNCFGVYASVVRTGRIREGAPIYLLEEDK
ncbi:MOSC domain-containing protein [Brevibacillus humidisoli]|uniref:MOSC domain-containing protein n=1 Tax=Brevibacillus humidisoli TaxID=2895522 RepID=UPI001E55E16F|nr:MOSC N-terminal beta barrel domain-containing protein [Brevibacillus humidisoli]UFJ43056.1 MOSC domain-containing protein [Brevibacillus humidisoli]